MKPLDYIQHIDEMYNKYVGKIDRIDPLWGEWSRDMNLEIRKTLEDKSTPKDIKIALSYVVTYWTETSQLLRMNFRKKKFLGDNKIKKKKRELVKIANYVANPLEAEDISGQSLLGRVMS